MFNVDSALVASRVRLFLRLFSSTLIKWINPGLSRWIGWIGPGAGNCPGKLAEHHHSRWQCSSQPFGWLFSILVVFMSSSPYIWIPNHGLPPDRVGVALSSLQIRLGDQLEIQSIQLWQIVLGKNDYDTLHNFVINYKSSVDNYNRQLSLDVRHFFASRDCAAKSSSIPDISTLKMPFVYRVYVKLLTFAKFWRTPYQVQHRNGVIWCIFCKTCPKEVSARKIACSGNLENGTTLL